MPRTLLEGRSDEHVAPTAADRLDVAIVSTPIDLALAEGVSEYVTKLGGQAQVDVRVTGSGRDPHVEGAVFLIDGTFVVPDDGRDLQEHGRGPELRGGARPHLGTRRRDRQRRSC